MKKIKAILNQNDISHFFIMYNELCVISFKNKKYKNTLKFFYKALKYYDIIYENALRNPKTTQKELNNIEENFLDIKSLAIDASNKVKFKKTDEKNIEVEMDEYEKILYSETNKEFFYDKIAQLLFESCAFFSAITFFKKSLQINPNNYINYQLIADCYNKMQELDTAVIFYKKYNEFFAGNPYIYNALGEISSVKDRYGNLEEQKAYFEKALEIAPNYPEAIKNLAITCRNMDKDEEAAEHFSKLIKLSPTHDNYFNYACQKIKLKDFEEGWKYFEHRFGRETIKVAYPKFKQQRWDGEENIQDKTLLVQYEQGLGDSIQFFRYLSQINAKKIIFRVQDCLADLLTINVNEISNIDNIEIVKKSVPIEDLSFDYHVPIMSLPYHLKARVDNIPLSKGYIKADENKIKNYKKKYFNNDCFKIGITWQGAALGNLSRNVPFECFYALAKLKNVKIYSFQKEFDPKLFENLQKGLDIINLGETFEDFSDTAAAMANIDLFVTGDNAVFNLAGAMGKKTFLLLNRDCEWRWFQDEDKTPWYDSVKIFKKKKEKESWDLLFSRLIEYLKTK